MDSESNRRRGRPSEDYQREEFVNLVQTRREFLGWSLCALARFAHVDRSTLSQILSRKRPCARTDRERILNAVGIPSELVSRFCPDHETTSEPTLRWQSNHGASQRVASSTSTRSEPRYSDAGALLETARGLRAYSQFSDSRTILLDLIRDARGPKNQLLRAELAGDLSWLAYEQGSYHLALQWYEYAADALETLTGFAVEEILRSIRIRSQSSLLTFRGEASCVLSRILHIRRKTLIERTVYSGNGIGGFSDQGFIDARRAVREQAELDTFLNLDNATANNKLWSSILLVNGREIRDREAERDLEEARSIFPRGGLGELYLYRARGIFYCRTGEEGLARERLLDAAVGFPSFADARALGPTFYWLSQVERQGCSGSYEQRLQLALRYALAGVAVHPYGFVRENAIELLKDPDAKRFLGAARNDLEAGRGLAFKIVHRMLEELSHRSGKSAHEAIRESLQLARVI